MTFVTFFFICGSVFTVFCAWCLGDMLRDAFNSKKWYIDDTEHKYRLMLGASEEQCRRIELEQWNKRLQIEEEK